MRRMSAALVAISPPSPSRRSSRQRGQPSPRPSQLGGVSPTKVKAGQMVKVSGGGCQGITVLIFFIDSKEFHRGSTKSGDWSYQVKLPKSLKSGDHDMWAECKGSKHKPARFHVDKGKKDKDDDKDKDKGKKHKKSKRSFNAYPDVVTAGDKVWVEGTGCKKYASVKIKLDGKTVKRTYADKHGTFDKGVRIPRHIKKGRHVLSAKCGGRDLGSDGIKVKKKYKQDRDHVLHLAQRRRGRQEAAGPWRRLPRRRSGTPPWTALRWP